ncbi:MAG: DUF975 family protein [Bacilli bacterium]|nr:DUF975 family protein [Bacilli bacterium]
MDRKLIKSEAKQALVGNRLMFLLAIIIVGVISGTGIGAILAPILGAGLFLIGKVLLLEKKFNFELIIEYFKDLNHALRLIGATLLYALIVFIGFLLFIIPGIIFSYQYSQVMYILAEDKEIGVWDAFKKSKEMMVGYKFDLFIFHLSFIGHILLGMITFGIYLLYAMPYMQLSYYNYYLHLKGKDVVETSVASA